MRNKKGFTLIELILVIALIAVLMLVVYPKIASSFSSAKKDAFKLEVDAIKKEAEKKYVEDSLNGHTTTKFCDESFSDLGCEVLDIQHQDRKYRVELDSKGKVSAMYLSYGRLCIAKVTDGSTDFDVKNSDIQTGAALECTDGYCLCKDVRGKSRITVTVNNGTSDVGSAYVDNGNDALFTISPKIGYTLQGANIVGGCTLEGNILKYEKIKEDKNCIVTLEEKNCVVNLVCTHCSAETTTQTIPAGANAFFTITPDSGYDLANATVTGGCSLNGNIVKAENVADDRTCNVNVGKPKYAVTLTCTNCTPASETKQVEEGTNGTYTLTAATVYTLTGATVSGTGCSLNESTGVLTVSNVTSARSCSVTAKKQTNTVTVSCTGCTSNPTSATVDYNGSKTFTITASTGYTLTGATVSGTGCTLSGSTLTASNVTSARTCSVTAKKQTYTVSVSCTGCTSNPTSASVEYGSSQTFTISASSGYTTSGATVSGTGCSISGTTLTASNVTSARTCSVTLPKDAYTVTVSCTGCTSSPTSKSIAYNSSGTFTITAASGYSLTGATVSGTGCSLNGSTGVLTASNVTSDRTCTVTAKSSSCTVYCTSSTNCSATQPTSGFYGSFTCTNGKTGSLINCFYGSTQCNGGRYGSSNPTQMCKGTTRRNIRNYCNSSLSGTTVAGINVSSSNYNCSCN